MVRALLNGTKTQTRRVVKNHVRGLPAWCEQMKGRDDQPVPRWFVSRAETERVGTTMPCPHGEAGDRLWVKESAWITKPNFAEPQFASHPNGALVQYYASNPDSEGPDGYGIKRKPSIFMPRWASRITLEITDVRVQRLQDISEADAQAEGVQPYKHIGAEQRVPGPGFGGVLLMEQPHRLPFADLWDSINGEDAWTANPWVWALTFKRVTP